MHSKTVVRLFFFLISVFCLSPSPVCANSFWVTEGHTAKITLAYPQAKDSKTAITFYVDWDPSSRCSATIGMITLLKGDSIGKFEGSKKASENLVVTVGGRNWSTETMIAQYSNALDVMSYASTELLGAMANSNSAQFKFLGSPSFYIPLDGASSAIEAARKNCR